MELIETKIVKNIAGHKERMLQTLIAIWQKVFEKNKDGANVLKDVFTPRNAQELISVFREMREILGLVNPTSSISITNQTKATFSFAEMAKKAGMISDTPSDPGKSKKGKGN